MVFTRRTGPLGGAGVLVLVLPPALWYSGAPLVAAVVGVFIYQVLFLWLPMPAALTLLPTLRAMGEQRAPLAVHHEAGVADHGRRQAHRPSQPAPVAAPHRALSSAGLSRPGQASGERRSPGCQTGARVTASGLDPAAIRATRTFARSGGGQRRELSRGK